MREKWQKQMPLMSHILDHPQSKELEVISNIIDENATIRRYVLQDLNRGKLESHHAGAHGMSADQVLDGFSAKVKERQYFDLKSMLFMDCRKCDAKERRYKASVSCPHMPYYP
jgi:hypothetical protein